MCKDIQFQKKDNLIRNEAASIGKDVTNVYSLSRESKYIT